MADETGAPPAPRRTFLQSLLVFFDKRIAVMMALGFSSGIPNLMAYLTLAAWFRSVGLTLETISLFSLVTLTYALKFLWAPLIDRTTIPVLGKLLGQRRSWMIVAQACVCVGLLATTLSDPKSDLGWMALFVAFVAFSGATQDIVIDAWRIEVAETSRQGAMATAYQWGYRTAILITGAVPLFLTDVKRTSWHVSWNVAYGAVSCLMIIGVIGVLLAPREREHAIRHIETGGLKEAPALEVSEWALRLLVLFIGAAIAGSGLSGKPDILSGALSASGMSDAAAWLKHAWTAKPDGIWLQILGVFVGLGIVIVAALPIPRVRTRPGVYLSTAFGEPLKDFFQRFGKTAGLILALICFYRLSDFVLNLMTNFYQDLGFSGTEIAEAQKVFGFWATIGGVFLGGLAVARLGVMRAMIIGAFALPVTNTLFGLLAIQGPIVKDFFAVIAIENVASGFAGTCLIAYMSSLTAVGFTATQYALFSSLYALPGKIIASQSGRIVESAARASDKGGFLHGMQSLFVKTPTQAFATAMTRSHVTPHALGVGYVVFFLYAGGVGILSMVLVLLVARGEKAHPSAVNVPSS